MPPHNKQAGSSIIDSTLASTVYLIDASIYIFRAWFSLPDSIIDSEGECINAAYGYLLFISKFVKSINSPSSSCSNHSIAFAFDESLNSCFRNTLYPLYKSNRGLPDDNLAYQLRLCRKLTESLGFFCVSSKKYEADDLIGSLLKQYRSHFSKQHNKSTQGIILTKDKDLGQLLSNHDKLWDFSAEQFTNQDDFEAKYGVPSKQFIDYLALVGDAVDEIPGVAGIGPKAAVELLSRFTDIETLYENIDAIADPAFMKLRGAKRIQSLLREYQAEAFLSKKLATIRCDIHVTKDMNNLHWHGVSSQRFECALTRHHIQGRNRKALTQAFNALYIH